MRLSSKILLSSLALLTTNILAQFPSPLPEIYISEILPDAEGDEGTNEYVELRGVPNSTIPANTYLVNIEGDSVGPGDVNDAFDLSGLTFGSSGTIVLLAANTPFTPFVDPGATLITGSIDGFDGVAGHINDPGGFDLENDSNTFLLIVTDGSANGNFDADTDIDTDDNGIIDTGFANAWEILDGVATLDDAGGGEVAYGPVIVFTTTAAGSITAPDAVTIVDLDALGFTDEPGILGRVGSSTGFAEADWFAAALDIPNTAGVLSNADLQDSVLGDIDDTDPTIITNVTPSQYAGESLLGTLGSVPNLTAPTASSANSWDAYQ